MKEWWDNLQPRERLIVGVSAALLLLMIAYLEVWEPMTTKHQELTTDIQAQRESLNWMQQSAQEIEQLRGSAPAPRSADDSNRSMLAIVDSAAKQNHLREPIQRMVPQGKDTVKLWMENASFDALITWLNVLRHRHGIRVTRATISRQDKQGRVNSQLSLSRS